MLYFAYGSNCSVDQMLWRCPDARVVAPVVLADWALMFRGTADIVHKTGAKVPGVLWRLTGRDLRALDRWEGHPHKYIRRTIRVNRGPKVLAYVFRDRPPYELPTMGYLQRIIDGYRDFSLPHKYLKQALTASARRGTMGLANQGKAETEIREETTHARVHSVRFPVSHPIACVGW